MKLSELISLYTNLKICETLNGKSENITKFLYGIVRNIILIEPEIKVYEIVSAFTKEYIEYDKNRVELCKHHSNKDGNGNPIIKNNIYDILDIDGNMKEDFIKDLEKLNKDNKSVIDYRENQLLEIEKLKEEEIEIELYKIKLGYIPEDISKHVGLMKSIMCIIEE